MFHINISFTYFPGEIIFSKWTDFRELRANHQKISANSQFTEHFLARKLSEISVFYTVCCFYNIQWTHFLTIVIGCGSSTLRTKSWERLSVFKQFKFILQVPFSRTSNISNELPLTMCACQLQQSYFQIIMHFLFNVYYLQCFILENNIRTFTVIDDVQK